MNEYTQHTYQTDNLILLQEYHTPQNEARQNEYLKCLETNIKNKYIKKIEIFIEPDTKPPIESSKINYNIVSDRPTFQDLFYFCNKTYPDQICMISNADIMFDNTLSFINQDNMKNKFIALTRRDHRGKEEPFASGGWCQDTWIFKCPVKIKGANFTMGIRGCDNRIAYLAHKSGMLVTNPSDQIKARHIHQSEYRTKIRCDAPIVLGRHLWVHPNNNINKPSILKICKRYESGEL